MAVDPDREFVRRDAGAAACLAVELGQRPEPRGLAADDRDRQRQAERAGARDRLRRAAGSDPDRKRLLQSTRIDALAVERRSMPALPRDHGLGADLKQEIELLREQLVVIVEVVAEQRKGLDERAAPGHDLRPAAGDEIERGELLIDAHRIVRRQHRDGARQANALGARSRRGQRHRRRRHCVIRPMMFAEPEHIEADTVGKLDLLQNVGEAFVDVDRLAGRGIAPGLDEGVSAKLHERPRRHALLGAGGAMLEQIAIPCRRGR